jgi:undecaprenyl-diphosphatase
MGWLDIVRQFDLQLLQLVNGWAGKNEWRDAVGIFAALHLIWVMGLLALVPLLRRSRKGTPERIRIASSRSWFFPSGMPASAAAAPQADAGYVRLKGFLILGLAPLIAFAVRTGIGAWIGRVRPYAYPEVAHQLIAGLSDPSFPSGHAAVSFAIAGAVWYRSPFLGVLFFIGAVLVAIGRVYVGVHYPADVVGGALLGVVSAVVVKGVVSFYFRSFNSKLKSQMSNPQLKAR